MGKISPVAAKYIIHSSIEIDGVVERPDVIGAIFGQTEGLLGADLELRELQRSGRIGRIEVNVDTRTGKTKGTIIIPSSLDKAETSIVAAALEIIQRIGPCNAKIKVENIEDVRVSKRHFVVERAKELLKMMQDKVLPDSQEITDEVAQSVRVMELQQYGRDRLAAGPAIDESDEVIVVEGRADVLNLLKNGIKNAIAMNGTSCPETIKELGKKKTLTAFVDGDRGGNLIIKELTTVAELDFVARAPDGKEVEELTKKEIHKALRGRITSEQAKLELSKENGTLTSTADNVPSASAQQMQTQLQSQSTAAQERPQFISRPQPPRFSLKRGKVLTPDEKQKFRTLLDDLIGTRGAYILDDKMNILGKVPVSELATTIKSLGTMVYAVILDGVIDKALVEVAERANVTYAIAMDNKVKQIETKLSLLTAADL